MANSEFKFTDNTMKVLAAMDDKILAVLEECAGELESQTKRNTRVDTGKTKNSWRHRVAKEGNVFIAVVGSDYENAIWEELGTGEYAINGDGRKGGWVYYADNGRKVTYNKDGSIRKNSKYKSSGNYVFTLGKKPSRAFWNAYSRMKSRIILRIQNEMKEL